MIMGEVESALSNRLRVRVCGIIVAEGSVLMVHMQSPTRKEPIWTPPGGGLEYGETLRNGVVREVLEETGLIVDPRYIMYTSEFIKAPYHAVEYYWYCELTGGHLRLGTDPEYSAENQFLKSVDFLALHSLADHPVFPEYLRYHLFEDLRNPLHQNTHFSQIY
jgi:8-oxo-dGTP diphosphatase